MEVALLIVGGLFGLLLAIYALIGWLSMLPGIIWHAALMLVGFLLFGHTGAWVVFGALTVLAVFIGFKVANGR